MIEVQGLDVELGGRPVLRAVTCAFPRGATALVGRNGAGKTTLLRSLCGLLPTRRGSILVDGRDPRDGGGAGRDLRAELGWMPQDARLPRRVRVVDIVRYAAWLRRVSGDVEVGEALDAVDLTERAECRIGQLSGGQQRRAALACAIVGRPAVLLLDEPTVGLDPEQRDHFLRMIKQLSRDRTVVVSTHLIEDVLGVADHVVGLSEGEVTRVGSLGALIDQLPRGAAPAEILAHLRALVLAPQDAAWP